MKTRRFNKEEIKIIEGRISRPNNFFKLKETYLIALIVGSGIGCTILNNTRNKINIVSIVAGFLICFVLLFIFDLIMLQLDKYLYRKDLKRGLIHIVKGPMEIKEFNFMRLARSRFAYRRNYYVEKHKIDIIYSPTDKSEYDKYEEGDILEVEYIPSSGYIFNVKKVDE